MSHLGYKKILKSEADVRFPSFQQGFNQRWFSSNCQAVYLCHDAQGTAAALDDAIASYSDIGSVKIKSGGHCYENFVFNEDTAAILDVTPMDEAGLDPDLGYYLGSGGTNWGAFKALFRDYGKVLPAGSCYSVGLGGHICGGGDGILSRLYGLTVDWLTGVDIVVKDDANLPAKVKYVSCDSVGDDYDLYWSATGGGGGNFGVITRYYFKTLPDSPKGAIISSVSISWDGLTPEILKNVLDWYVDFAAQEDNWRTSLKFQMMHKSAGELRMTIQSSYFNEEQRIQSKVYVHQLENELEQITGNSLLKRVASTLAGHAGWWSVPPAPRNFNTREQDAITESTGDYTYYEAEQTLNSSGPNQRGKYKSAYQRKRFPTEQIQIIYNRLQVIPNGLTADDMKQSLLQVDTFAGKINTVSPTATAIAQRSYLVKLQYQTYWLDKSQDEEHLSWIRGFYEEMYAPYGGIPNPDPAIGLFEGCYYNYPDVDLNAYGGRDGALTLYFLDNYEKNPRNLVKIKRRWDPNNFFHNAQSIPVK
ncbi:MAG: FAD-binding protein [Oscillatoria sp. SIO1A7]|nr:FAD-binding protein [Oscillatoria sp. SIO1A7]